MWTHLDRSTLGNCANHFVNLSNWLICCYTMAAMHSLPATISTMNTRPPLYAANGNNRLVWLSLWHRMLRYRLNSMLLGRATASRADSTTTIFSRRNWSCWWHWWHWWYRCTLFSPYSTLIFRCCAYCLWWNCLSYSNCHSFQICFCSVDCLNNSYPNSFDCCYFRGKIVR